MTNFDSGETAAPTTVTVSLSLRDADYYCTYARRPAVPVVKSQIQQALYRLSSLDSRVEVAIPREQAEQFVRKSTRPMRLPSGSTLKTLIKLALDEIGQTPDTAESRRAAAEAAAAETNLSEVGNGPATEANTPPGDGGPFADGGDESPEPSEVYDDLNDDQLDEALIGEPAGPPPSDDERDYEEEAANQHVLDDERDETEQQDRVDVREATEHERESELPAVVGDPHISNVVDEAVIGGDDTGYRPA